MYVIKFDDNSYYAGYAGTHNQLRKAMVYVSIKKCMEAGQTACKKLNKNSFKIIQIEMREIGEV